MLPRQPPPTRTVHSRQPDGVPTCRWMALKPSALSARPSPADSRRFRSAGGGRLTAPLAVSASGCRTCPAPSRPVRPPPLIFTDACPLCQCRRVTSAAKEYVQRATAAARPWSSPRAAAAQAAAQTLWSVWEACGRDVRQTSIRSCGCRASAHHHCRRATRSPRRLRTSCKATTIPQPQSAWPPAPEGSTCRSAHARQPVLLLQVGMPLHLARTAAVGMKRAWRTGKRLRQGGGALRGHELLAPGMQGP